MIKFQRDRDVMQNINFMKLSIEIEMGKNNIRRVYLWMDCERANVINTSGRSYRISCIFICVVCIVGYMNDCWT